MLCKKCDKEIPDDALFCSYCGKKQARTAAPPKKRNRRVSGTGGICKLSGKRRKPYEVKVFIGRQYKSMGTFATESEAALFLQNLDIENLSNRTNWTLKQFYDIWTESKHYNKLSKSAVQAYSAAWSRLSVLENEKMRNLKTSDFQHIVDNAVKKKRYKTRTAEEVRKMSDKERQRYYALVSQPDEPLGFDGKKDIKELAGFLCELAMKDDVLNKNYASMIELENEDTKVQKLNFTAEQISIITQHDYMTAAKITLIFLYTGMRAAELLEMKKAAVDLPAMTMTGGSKTEAGRNRTIPIHRNIVKYVEFFLDSAPDCDHLITENGKPVSYEKFTRRMFYPMLDELGITRQDADGNNILTLHRTRHTWVQMAIEGGMTPEALQKIAGHAKYETSVNKYGDKISTEYLKAEMEKV